LFHIGGGDFGKPAGEVARQGGARPLQFRALGRDLFTDLVEFIRGRFDLCPFAIHRRAHLFLRIVPAGLLAGGDAALVGNGRGVTDVPESHGDEPDGQAELEFPGEQAGDCHCCAPFLPASACPSALPFS